MVEAHTAVENGAHQLISFFALALAEHLFQMSHFIRQAGFELLHYLRPRFYHFQHRNGRMEVVLPLPV